MSAGFSRAPSRRSSSRRARSWSTTSSGASYLTNAVALNSAAFNVSRSVGPAVCGLLIHAFGLDVSYYVQAALFAFATLWTGQMRVPQRPAVSAEERAAQPGLLASAGEGFAYILSNRLIRSLMTLGLAPILLGMPYTSLMPIFAIDVLHGDASTQGLLLTTVGAGAVVGALTVASLGRRQGSGRLLVIGAAGFGLSLVLFARSPVLWMMLPFAFAAGLTNSAYTSQNQTLLQMLTPDRLRGRVLGTYMLNRGLMPMGSMIAGALASALGGPWAVTIMGASCLAVAVAVATQAPELWRLGGIRHPPGRGAGAAADRLTGRRGGRLTGRPAAAAGPRGGLESILARRCGSTFAAAARPEESMEPIDADHLSLSIDRDASLFERKSDLLAFLERVARSVTESGAARACGIYVSDRADGGLTLRAVSGQAAGLPTAPDGADAISSALKERRASRVAARDGTVRVLLPITRGPDGLGVLVADLPRGGTKAGGSEEAELRDVASRLGSVLENATILLDARPEGGSEPAARPIEGETAATGVAEGTALPFDALSAVPADAAAGRRVRRRGSASTSPWSRRAARSRRWSATRLRSLPTSWG